jgi:hypothetical protein
VPKRFALGESLVGQAALERKTIQIDEPPADYIRISSGLGSAVQDATPLAPPANTSPFAVERRHGIGIVATIAADWGVEHLRDGKIVWAQIRA